MSAMRNFWSELPGAVVQCCTDSFTWRYNQNLWMHHLTEGATYLPL
jgi:hypothetical protein